MSKVILLSQTNSNRDIPAKAEFIKAELDQLISEYGSLIDWENSKGVLSLKISTLPECFLQDEDGNDWDGDEVWEQTVSDVSNTGINIIFIHAHTGDELFFEYSNII